MQKRDERKNHFIIWVNRMKICFMCDLHLPFDTRALQYDVLKWAASDIEKNSPDCVAFVGDVTCDGNEESYDFFLNTVGKLNTRVLYIPGNSDLRCEATRESIKRKSSPCVNLINGTVIYAINDCDGEISSVQLSSMQGADEGSIVFMHHPPKAHNKAGADGLLEWRKTHPKTMLFYGHLHLYKQEDRSISLPAMDPDKSIGEAPCIVYYDTVTEEMSKSHYSVSVPENLSESFGISCYKPTEQIRFATEKRLKCLELRPNCIGVDRKELTALIEEWRSLGGENLSVHLPDIGYSNGEVTFDPHYDEVLEIVSLLKADRMTQHVPKVSLSTVERDHNVLKEICEALAARFNRISHAVTVGVENMHMTDKETPDGSRRFGYTPEECIQFMRALDKCCEHKIGINFDIGHARNNAPYSQRYQVGTWLSMLGEHIVGYHMHQVTYDNLRFENHMPITHIYGSLISLASFFKYWEMGRINEAPIVFEMRDDGAYEKTLTTFDGYIRNR